MSTAKDLDLGAQQKGFSSDDHYQFCRLNERFSLDLVSMKAGRRLRKTDEKWKEEFETAGKLAEKLRSAATDTELDVLDTAFDQYESNQAQYDQLRSQNEKNKGEQSLNNLKGPNEKHANGKSVASDDADEESDNPPSAGSHNSSRNSPTAGKTSFGITDLEMQN